jgi:hypothetical protein
MTEATMPRLPDAALTLKVSIRPQWEELETVRDQTLSFLLERKVDPDTCNAVAMVAAELLENAAKYGIYRRSCDSIELALRLEDAVITTEVCNPLGPAELEHVERLDMMIQWIRGFQDPFEAYLERLKEVSSQSLETQDSGLGLVRIAYEGGSVLDFFIREQNVLSVSAVHPRTFGARP